MDEVSDGTPNEGNVPPDVPAWLPEWGTDLASHRPGHAVLANIQTKLATASLETQQGLPGAVPEDLRNWAVGYVGEEHVGLELARLTDGWFVLHGVPIGVDGSDIDHVVLGPPGVFTINTKHHRGQTVDVKGEAAFIAGNYQPYIPKSRTEANRTRTILAPNLPAGVPVYPTVCVVGGAVRVKEPVVGVAVVTSPNLVPTLAAQRPLLSRDQVTALYEVARRSKTWTDVLPPPPAAEWVADYARRLATPPTPAISATGSPDGPRRSRSRTSTRPSSTRTRGRSKRRSGSPAQILVAIAIAIFVFLALGGAKVLTSAIQGMTQNLLPGAAPTPASTAYIAAISVPAAAPGGSCPSTKARGRYPLNNQLLLCRPVAKKKLVWVFADPWLRLPASLAGMACSPVAAHARSVMNDGALICRKNTAGALTWDHDPGWTP